MSLSLGDAARVLEMERRIDALEEQIRKMGLRLECVEVETLGERQIPRRGRPPKNLEERMKNQENDPIDAE